MLLVLQELLRDLLLLTTHLKLLHLNCTLHLSHVLVHLLHHLRLRRVPPPVKQALRIQLRRDRRLCYRLPFRRLRQRRCSMLRREGDVE